MVCVLIAHCTCIICMCCLILCMCWIVSVVYIHVTIIRILSTMFMSSFYWWPWHNFYSYYYTLIALNTSIHVVSVVSRSVAYTCWLHADFIVLLGSCTIYVVWDKINNQAEYHTTVSTEYSLLLLLLLNTNCYKRYYNMQRYLLKHSYVSKQARAVLVCLCTVLFLAVVANHQFPLPVTGCRETILLSITQTHSTHIITFCARSCAFQL